MARERRWPVITALGVVQILAWGSSFYLLAVLAAPIVADTGWPLPWVVGGISIGLLIAGLVSPRVGLAIGAHGGRPVLALSAVLLALGLALLGAAPNLPVFFAAWVLLGLGMGTGLYDAAFATLGRLYGASARSAITTLTLLGGFASTVCWPLAALLVSYGGWRTACFTFAVLQLVVSLPLIWLMIPSAPPGIVPATPASGHSAALRPEERAAFLVFAAILTVGGTVMTLLSVHLITLMQARGLDLAAAVGLGTLIGPSQVGARVLEMAGRGRHHPLWTLSAAMSLIAVGVILLGGGYANAAIAIALYGGGNGIYSIARGTLPLALFGPERYPALMGRLARPALVAQALAPSLGAFAIAHWGSGVTFELLSALALLNVALVAALWPISRRVRRARVITQAAQ
ncbi:MFS transporter [Xanthobacter sp. DSM 24535]|uniref:MFS transporter n=1 Tax=Roseixanthobacter psychrophilus TaxID=3119917 RepID=UPI003727D8F5